MSRQRQSVATKVAGQFELDAGERKFDHALWLGDGQSLYDTLGFEFTLLALGARPADTAPFRAAAAALNMPLAVVPVPGDEARDLYGADLALIRPDQIVAWRGNSAADAIGVLRQAVGQTG